MQKTTTLLEEIKLVGIKLRTRNSKEFDPTTAQIGQTINKYHLNQIAHDIPNRRNPGVTYCVYTEYDSDVNGEYSYFIGEEVNAINNIPEGLTACIIPKQKYTRFTTSPGIMPSIVINAWQEIWQMSKEDLGGVRSYQADFEIYDQRARDLNNAIVDIYIGIK